MDDFLLFFSNERSLVGKLSTYLTKTPLLSNDLQRIIALNLLDAHIEYFTNFPSESLLKKVTEKSPNVIKAFSEVLDFPFERRFMIERYISNIIKKSLQEFLVSSDNRHRHNYKAQGNNFYFYKFREYTLKRNKEEIISRTGECFPWNPLEGRGLRHIYILVYRMAQIVPFYENLGMARVPSGPPRYVP